jgi:hypothetical protein
MSVYEPFHELYEDYQAALRVSLPGSLGDKVANAITLERQDAFDAAWHHVSLSLPPLTNLGAAVLTKGNVYSLLHVAARQAVWEDEGEDWDEYISDKLALVTAPVEAFLVE